jgi:elongation factor G
MNLNRSEEERFGPLLVMRGKEQIQVDTMHAGDIGAIAKLAHTITGDTLGDKAHPATVVPPDFPKPVYSVALSPVAQADSAKMGPTLTRLCDEDPTLQWRSCCSAWRASPDWSSESPLS